MSPTVADFLFMSCLFVLLPCAIALAWIYLATSGDRGKR